jgi:hypothetical protein
MKRNLLASEKIDPMLFHYRQVSLYCVNRDLSSCGWELSWRRVCLSIEKAACGLKIGKIF